MDDLSTIQRRRLLGSLFVSESLFSAAIIACFTLMPIVAEMLSGRDSMAGFPATAMLVGQAAAAYPVGRLMDRVGRRPGLSFGYFVAALGGVVAALSVGWGTFAGFCLGAGLFGIGRAAGLQARFAAAEIQTPQRQANAIGLIVFAGTIGAIGGPLLVAPSMNFVFYRGFMEETGPFFLAALLFYVAFLLTFFLLRPDPMHVAQRQAAEPTTASGHESHTARTLRQIFAASPVQLALAAMVVGQLVMTLIMVITPLYMNRLGYATSNVSWVIMAHTLGMFGLSGVTGWLIDRVGQQKMIAAGAALLALAAILAPLSTQLAPLMVALFVLGLGWNFCFIAGSSLLTNSLSVGERGSAQGANDMMVATASGAGSLSTGALFGLGGVALVSSIGLGIVLLLFGFVAWTARRPALPVPAGD